MQDDILLHVSTSSNSFLHHSALIFSAHELDSERVQRLNASSVTGQPTSRNSGSSALLVKVFNEVLLSSATSVGFTSFVLFGEELEGRETGDTEPDEG